MRRSLLVVVLALLFCAPAARSAAQALTPDERALFDKEISKFVRVEPKRLADPAVVKVFAAPFYEVAVTIKVPESESTNSLIVSRVGSDLVPVQRPSGDEELPALLKMLNPAFRLATDADARTLQSALDIVYPVIGADSDKKAVTHRRAGNDWIFVRGTFFDDLLGFVFTTDGKGAITAAKFALKLPK